MRDLIAFFHDVFPALWDFFNIEFPLLGMTVFQVLIASIFISLGFRVIRWVFTGNDIPVVSSRDRPDAWEVRGQTSLFDRRK